MAICVIAEVGLAPCQYTNLEEMKLEVERAEGRGCLTRSVKLARLVRGACSFAQKP